MLEKLLQAAVITLLLSLLAAARSPKASEAPSFSSFQAFSLPSLSLHMQTPSPQQTLTH
ncbi:hypothetical protein ACKFKG_10775 [Phormidesmis sp. 146-35]